MSKTITDVIAYLLENGQKPLAEVVVKELQNTPQIIRETSTIYRDTSINNRLKENYLIKF